jgi:hypothetical protein
MPDVKRILGNLLSKIGYNTPSVDIFASPVAHLVVSRVCLIGPIVVRRFFIAVPSLR